MNNQPNELHQLFTEHWEAWMRQDPLFATMCGDGRYNHRLPGANENAYQNWRIELARFRQKLASIPRASLPDGDQLNYDLFERFLDNEINELNTLAYRIPITKAGGFHQMLPDIYQLMPFITAHDYENYLARLSAIPVFIHENIELMKTGIETDFIPPRITMEGVTETIQALLVEEATQSTFYKPFEKMPENLLENDISRLSKAARMVISQDVLPAFKELLVFMQASYIPAARQGIAASELPNGKALYQHRIRYFTTLDLTPEAIHQTGLAEVRRIRAEMETAILQAGFQGDLHDFIEFLRNDPQFYANNPAELLKEVAYVLKRIDGELPRLFKTLPRLPYGIRPIPDYAAPGNTTAYYQPGTGDGTIAGNYYVNTYDLKSRPFYEIEALSLHEAVPGHHLQIARQYELGELPMFRRFGWFTAYVEGWALYSERLGLEMGFFTDPYSNFGRLSYEMWRACRLVVDTGMHALGWTRQQAIDFMKDNTSLTPLNIVNEVDRYIAWPGQALAYKIGELKIRALRAQAETALGDHFDRRVFHNVILDCGPVPLDVLEEIVKDWITLQKQAG